MATLMMGIGTGLSVSLVAIVTLYARAWIEKFVTGGSSEHSYHVFSHYARGLGGIVLIALGWSFYSAASTLSAGHPLF
jgi:ABC-type nickel/cobalt efflux system permease component RcnA